MTVTREELLRAAYASTDDTERLVYADWLEGHGEVARAQVIHLQCELAKLGKYDRRRVEIEWELEAVLAELGDRWKDELPALQGVEWTHLERGMPAGVRCESLSALVEHAGAIIAAAPTVTKVELEDVDDVEELPAMPWLRTLRLTGIASSGDAILSVPAELEIAIDEYETLDFLDRNPEAPLRRLSIEHNATIGADLAEQLADAPWAKQLQTLYLPTSRAEETQSYYDADPRLSAGGTEYLENLVELESLTIDRQGSGARAVERLFAALPKLRELSARECDIGKLDLAKSKGASIERLDLSVNRIGNAGAHTIAHSPRLRAIKELALDTCEIEAVGLVDIMRPPLWDELRILNLSRNPLGPAGARAIAGAPRPANLHTLLLADADFDEAAATALGKAKWLGELAVLDLSGNPMGRGTAALREIANEGLRDLRLASTGMQRTEAAALARFWPKLVHLDIGGNAITDAGIERFATMKEAAALQTLVLRDCKLGDDGIDLLARARCPRLRSLDLGSNKLGAAAIEALLKAPMAKHLQQLDLSRCEIDAAGIAVLATTPMPPALGRLNLRGNGFDKDALLALAESSTLRAVPKLLLDGNPFTWDKASRERIAERFGADWYRED